MPEGGGGGEPIHCWGADSRGVAHAVAERAAGVPVEVAAGAGWSPAGSVSLARERNERERANGSVTVADSFCYLILL